MVKLFKASEPYVLVILAVYAILVNFNIFVEPLTPIADSAAPLSQLALTILQFITGGHPQLLNVCFIVLLLLQALMLNMLVERHHLIQKATTLPAFCYILLIALFNEYIFLAPPFFANFAIIIALWKVFASYNRQDLPNIFDAGFAIGIASLFYLPSIVLVLFIYVALGVTRVFNWREWVISLAGVAVPYFLFFTYYFATNQLIVWGQTHFLTTTYYHYAGEIQHAELAIKAVVLAEIILLGMFFLQTNMLKSVVKVRKFLTVVVYLLSISVVAFLLLNQFSVEPIALLLIPLAVFLAYSFFQIDSSFYAEAVHLSFVSVLLFFQYLM